MDGSSFDRPSMCIPLANGTNSGLGVLPPTAQNVLNFMQFSEKLAKPYVGVPSNGNPGSAPDIDLSNVFTWVLLPLIPYLLVSTQLAFDWKTFLFIVTRAPFVKWANKKERVNKMTSWRCFTCWLIKLWRYKMTSLVNKSADWPPNYHKIMITRSQNRWISWL